MIASAPFRRTLRAFVRDFLRDDRRAVAGAVLLMLLVAAAEGVGALMLGPVLGLAGLVPGGGAARLRPFAFDMSGLTLGVALAAYAGLVALHGLVSWRRDTTLVRLRLEFVDRLRQQLFDDIGNAEWSFVARTQTAGFANALTADLLRISTAAHALLELVAAVVLGLAYALVALHASVPLSALFAGGGVLLLLSLRRQRRKSFELGQVITEQNAGLHGIVDEYLSGLKLTKSANAEPRLSQRFADSLRQKRRHALQYVHHSSFAQGQLRLGGTILMVLLIFGAVRLVQAPAAVVLVMVFVLFRLVPILSQLQRAYDHLLHDLPAYSAFVGMRESCRRAAEPRQGSAGYVLERGIRFERVSCGLAAGSSILQGVDLELAPRTTTALIGPSGAGKSTLADLFTGLLAPQEGAIFVDGRRLDDRRAWRERVAYVPQETFLFNASVRDNLLWTAPGADDMAIWKALDEAAADFVRRLPQGLDTALGERGIRLSGGERQRLAIARALLRKPLLLVLDEATSHMDRDNEQSIQDAIGRLHGHLTILVIAHRMPTVRNSDRILVLERGRITEDGSWDQLYGTPGSYLLRAARSS